MPMPIYIEYNGLLVLSHTKRQEREGWGERKAEREGWEGKRERERGPIDLIGHKGEKKKGKALCKQKLGR